MSGVANMQRGIDSMNRLKSAIRDLPLRIRTAVAKDAAGILNVELHKDFAAGETVYDTPRPLSVKGKPLTLVKTDRVRSALNFVVIGTILRAQLGTKYARYLIGKYKILPMSLPASWRTKLEQLVRDYREIFEREFAGASS